MMRSVILYGNHCNLRDLKNMIGTKYGKVAIYDYNSDWDAAFKTEKMALMEVLGNDVIEIEHVGSTSIVGMAAKPTIDIIAGLKALNAVDYYIDILGEIGYEFRPSHPVPSRLHFAKIVQSLRTHNLSLTEYDSQFWKNHILFRDYLRVDSETAEAYKHLKLRLAKEYPNDTVGYTEAKNVFIEYVLQKAIKL